MIPRPAALILASLVVGACSQEKGAELADDLARVQKKMCACPDRACADAVAVEHDGIEQRARATYGKLTNLPKSVINRLVVINNAYRDCLAQLTAGAPSTPTAAPDAGTTPLDAAPADASSEPPEIEIEPEEAR